MLFNRLTGQECRSWNLLFACRACNKFTNNSTNDLFGKRVNIVFIGINWIGNSCGSGVKKKKNKKQKGHWFNWRMDRLLFGTSIAPGKKSFLNFNWRNGTLRFKIFSRTRKPNYPSVIILYCPNPIELLPRCYNNVRLWYCTRDIVFKKLLKLCNFSNSKIQPVECVVGGAQTQHKKPCGAHAKTKL